MAELPALRVAAVLAANANFQVRPRFSSPSDGPLNEHAHTCNIDRLERIGRENSGLAFIYVVRQEPARILARQAHQRLGQVVCAERKELSDLRDLVCQQSSAWQLDHSS